MVLELSDNNAFIISINAENVVTGNYRLKFSV